METHPAGRGVEPAQDWLHADIRVGPSDRIFAGVLTALAVAAVICNVTLGGAGPSVGDPRRG